MTTPAPFRLAEHCAYCERPFGDEYTFHGVARTKDHIIPRSMTVAATYVGRGNEVAACGACNGIKANMMPAALRATAEEHRKRAELIDRMADRVDALIVERGLIPPAIEQARKP